MTGFLKYLLANPKLQLTPERALEYLKIAMANSRRRLLPSNAVFEYTLESGQWQYAEVSHIIERLRADQGLNLTAGEVLTYMEWNSRWRRY